MTLLTNGTLQEHFMEQRPGVHVGQEANVWTVISTGLHNYTQI